MGVGTCSFRFPCGKKSQGYPTGPQQPDNYIKYWEFLGRTIPESLKAALNQAAKEANKEGSNEPLRDGRFPELTAQMMEWRQEVDREPYDSTQSSGAYWAWTGAMRYADEEPQLRRRTRIVTLPKNGLIVYYGCESFGQVAATVNFGSPRKNKTSIDSVNGIIARYQAYTSALVILADRTSFLRERGKAEELPEGYERRKA